MRHKQLRPEFREQPDQRKLAPLAPTLTREPGWGSSAPAAPEPQPANDAGGEPAGARLTTYEEAGNDLTDFGSIANGITCPRINAIAKKVLADPSQPFNPQDFGVLKQYHRIAENHAFIAEAARDGVRRTLRDILRPRLRWLSDHGGGDNPLPLTPCDTGAFNLLHTITIAAFRDAKRRRTDAAKTVNKDEAKREKAINDRFIVRGKFVFDQAEFDYTESISHLPQAEQDRLLAAWQAEHGTWQTHLLGDTTPAAASA